MHVLSSQAGITPVSEKVKRKLLANGGSLMMVEVQFEEGGVGEPHSHDRHEQVSYIIKGSFKVTLGQQELVLAHGDSFYAPRDTVHGVVALESSSILDIFTPIREEFLP